MCVSVQRCTVCISNNDAILQNTFRRMALQNTFTLRVASVQTKRLLLRIGRLLTSENWKVTFEENVEGGFCKECLVSTDIHKFLKVQGTSLTDFLYNIIYLLELFLNSVFASL